MFKRRCFWFTVLLVGFSVSVPPLLAQAKGSASISGTVTLGGKPAKAVPVVASVRSETFSQKPPAATATTDEDGKYRIVGLNAGQYSIAPYQPASVLPDQTRWDPGSKSITVTDGETVSDVNFSLSAGGVITGRIVGQDGKPLIEQRVNVESADGKSLFGQMMSQMYQTDDRGMYRIYGIPPGRYIVSVGEDSKSGIVYGPTNAGYVQRTFYPGGTDRSAAQVIELGEGSVESGIDIAVGPREKTYSISGRMVDQATGTPVSDVPVAYSALSSEEPRIQGYGSSSSTDASGQFKVSSLRPGRYAIFAGNNYSGPTKWMSDVTVIEVTDSNVSDVEIKLRTGASIDGVAVIEGPSDAATLKRLSQLKISIFSWPTDTSQPPTSRSSPIASNGSFRFEALSPSKYSIGTSDFGEDQVLTIRRVEQDGAVINDNSVTIPEGGDHVNLRIVFEAGTGTIKGQVSVVGGEVPAGWKIVGSARRTDRPDGQPRFITIDSRGSFSVQHLAAGEYDVSISLEPPMTQGPPGPPAHSTRKTVTVTANTEVNVTLVLDMSTPKSGGDER